MEAECLSEMFVSMYQSMWFHISENIT